MVLDADAYREAIERAKSLRIGAPTLLECEIVARGALDDLAQTNVTNALNH